MAAACTRTYNNNTARKRWVLHHELAARHPHRQYYVTCRHAQRALAFSMLEAGIGRTLKGRDLFNLRNAVWLATGFHG
ncbi:hypothetical protein GOP47_0016465 [Adiantum capillus-veneris]|uniref:Uncharacterized protein n=1 Tax=Adiantum capillus-veneris TaxID=13818 RepID=A0A9D4UHR2_ADICA|nr:hypothetical protein GOP47_0016465 [Adiantum capillus-veneris]